MKILVINGPNLNMLGVREPELYGKKDFKSLVREIKTYARKKNVKVKCLQSNYEGKIVTWIQQAYKKYDGIVLNAGALTHTSVAVLDALKSVGIPTVEVHLTDIYSRDEFRRFSYVSLYAEKVVAGKGFDGYFEAIDHLLDKK